MAIGTLRNGGFFLSNCVVHGGAYKNASHLLYGAWIFLHTPTSRVILLPEVQMSGRTTRTPKRALSDFDIRCKFIRRNGDRVIGFFARLPTAEVICTDLQACVVAGSEYAMR